MILEYLKEEIEYYQSQTKEILRKLSLRRIKRYCELLLSHY